MNRIVIVFFLLLLKINFVSAQNCIFNNNENKHLTTSKLQQLSAVSYGLADIHYARCEWIIDPAVNFISGKITSYFQTKENLDSLSFDCSQDLIVDSIIFHSSLISFSHQNEILTLQFLSTIVTSTFDSVSVYYHGAPVPTGNGSFMKGEHAGAPVVWTLSEPFGAKDWWPCQQNTGDKIDSIDVICKIPAGNKCASIGKLISVDVSGSDLVYHWKSRYPVAPYLVALGVTNYVESSDSVVLSNSDTLQILNYVYPEQSANTLNALSAAPALVSFYDSLLTTYPFSSEKYGHAQFGWGGGMEHQTMSFVGSFGFELIAHELAHQWFGDKITCRSWTDIWLHEGFATYMAGMAIEKFYPEQFYPWKYSALQNIISEDSGSVVCNDTTDIARIFDGRLSYRKASFVLHMLRWKFGDEMFLLSLRNYLENSALKYSYASASDLRTSFELITSSDLTQFFDEWVYGEGFPEYRIIWNKNGNGIDMNVEQITSHSSVSFFHIPVPVQIGSATNDTIVVIDPDHSFQQFHFDLGFKPEYINVDPDIRIISGNNKTAESLPPGSIDDLIAVFPDPSHGRLELFAKRNDLRMLSYSILDMSGKLMLEESLHDGFKTELDISSLSNGVYVLRIVTDKSQLYKKIVLQK